MRLEVAPSLISQIETGRAQPSVSTLYSIAAEFNVALTICCSSTGVAAR
jgi:transcriptional regulator with XRE-family HTH domain